MRKSAAANCGILISLILFSGCATTFNEEMESQAKAKGWTEDQRLAALGFAYRHKFLKKNPKGEYEVNYGLLTKTQIRERMDKALKNIDELLGYKENENSSYTEEFGLRKSLEHEEQVLKAIRDRVRAAELYDQFRQLITGMPSEYALSHMRERVNGYDIRQIFLSTDIAKALEFNAGEIAEAKRRGVLKMIERASSSVNRKFDRKERNPMNPDDANDFVWKGKSRHLEVSEYKILHVEKPNDNQGNYLEGYRIINGKRESLPALRIFYFNDCGYGLNLPLPPNPSEEADGEEERERHADPAKPSLQHDPYDNPPPQHDYPVVYGQCQRGALILDTDKEGENGFGLPDIVEPVVAMQSASDILRNDRILNLLFLEKKEEKRVPPKKKPIFVEIAKVAPNMEVSGVWENAPDEKGWMAPFRYKNELETNYNVKLVFAKFEVQLSSSPANLNQQIKHLKKEWTSGSRYSPSIGSVAEYYRMKAPYNRRNLLRAEVNHEYDTKEVGFVFENGTQEAVTIVRGKNMFIEDEPEMVEYTEGQKRWRLVKDAGSKVFNRRKEVSAVKNETGMYGAIETD